MTFNASRAGSRRGTSSSSERCRRPTHRGGTLPAMVGTWSGPNKLATFDVDVEFIGSVAFLELKLLKCTDVLENKLSLFSCLNFK